MFAKLQKHLKLHKFANINSNLPCTQPCFRQGKMMVYTCYCPQLAIRARRG